MWPCHLPAVSVSRYVGFIFLLSHCSIASPFFVHAPASRFLTGAHQAYLKGDFATLVDDIRGQLEAFPWDELAKKNALQLVERALVESKRQGLKVSWHLPKEFSLLQINSARTDRDGHVYFRLTLRGDGRFIKIDQVKIVQNGTLTLLDKRGKVGACRDFGKDRLDFNERFTCSSPILAAPPEEGLYSIEIEFDGKRISGWFVLSGLTPETSPKILSPSPYEELTTNTPTFRWSGYLPSADSKFAKFSCTAYVTPQDNQASRWFIHFPTSKRRGSLPDAFVADLRKVGTRVGASQLDTGPYLLNVKCDDTWRFGDLTLGSERHAIRSFVVRSP